REAVFGGTSQRPEAVFGGAARRPEAVLSFPSPDVIPAKAGNASSAQQSISHKKRQGERSGDGFPPSRE
ncbi:hypothetical protein, partial [Sphingobium fuliginis]|uniref:hypothetical protein n=1 Tax=Sphingobium fuliginis (strain ATCC 27551) TaxID=336203 RepID=UPI001C3061A0